MACPQLGHCNKHVVAKFQYRHPLLIAALRLLPSISLHLAHISLAFLTKSSLLIQTQPQPQFCSCSDPARELYRSSNSSGSAIPCYKGHYLRFLEGSLSNTASCSPLFTQPLPNNPYPLLHSGPFSSLPHHSLTHYELYCLNNCNIRRLPDSSAPPPSH